MGLSLGGDSSVCDLPGVSSLGRLVSDGSGNRDSNYYEPAFRMTLIMGYDSLGFGQFWGGLFWCPPWCSPGVIEDHGGRLGGQFVLFCGVLVDRFGYLGGFEGGDSEKDIF